MACHLIHLLLRQIKCPKYFIPHPHSLPLFLNTPHRFCDGAIRPCPPLDFSCLHTGSSLSNQSYISWISLLFPDYSTCCPLLLIPWDGSSSSWLPNTVFKLNIAIITPYIISYILQLKQQYVIYIILLSYKLFPFLISIYNQDKTHLIIIQIIR